MTTLNLSAIADEYDAMPLLPNGRTERSEIVDLWADAGRYYVDTAEAVRRAIDVCETSDPEPYGDVSSQNADILGGRFLVSNAHCDHPVWTVEQNVSYRIVHDVFGHLPTGGGFDRHGELLVFWHQRAFTPSRLLTVHFTETVGQLAYACEAGDFSDDQKLGVMVTGRIG